MSHNVLLNNENYGLETLGIVPRSMPGRPKFEISRDQLQYLIEHNFTAVQISNMPGISLRIIRRRMHEQGLNTSQPFFELADEELDRVVVEIKNHHSKYGYRMVLGHLRSGGLKIQ
jgi:hypothetical protein